MPLKIGLLPMLNRTSRSRLGVHVDDVTLAFRER
jgi:hypothetical protein